jgi:hypothetical protein
MANEQPLAFRYSATIDDVTHARLVRRFARPPDGPLWRFNEAGDLHEVAASLQSIPGGEVPPEYEPEQPNPQPTTPTKTGDTE